LVLHNPEGPLSIGSVRGSEINILSPTYLILSRNLNDFVESWVTRVAIPDVRQYWLLPANVNGGVVEAPIDQILRGVDCTIPIDVPWHELGHRVESLAWDSGRPPRFELCWIFTGTDVLELRRSIVWGNTYFCKDVVYRGCGLGDGCTSVIEDSTAGAVVEVATVVENVDSEPIITDRLICRYDDVVTLA